MKFPLARRIANLFSKAGTMSPVSSRGWYPWIQEPYSGAWQQNAEIRQDDLLCSPIVYACVTLIANDIGKLRTTLVERSKNGTWNEVEYNSPFWSVLRSPNSYQNQIQFKQWWFTSKLRFGNAYALKERDARGVVTRLYLLDPCRVTPLVTDDGGIYYQLGQDNLNGVSDKGAVVPASEIIHDRMNCLFHQLVGVSPLFAASIAAGIGIRIQRSSAYFFGNSSNPSGFLVVPGNIDREKARELKQIWDDGYTGSNAGKVAVLADGMKFEAMSRTAVDSQLIETLKWTDERVCSVFHVPAYKVGVGTSPTYNNIEALAQEYYATCLQTLIEEFEACMDDGLGLDGINKGVELDLRGLMRMDSKTQIETLSAAVSGRMKLINEARRDLNLPPVEGGDTIWMQQQDTSLTALAERDRNAPALPAPLPGPSLPQESQIDAVVDEGKEIEIDVSTTELIAKLAAAKAREEFARIIHETA